MSICHINHAMISWARGKQFLVKVPEFHRHWITAFTLLTGPKVW